VKKAILTAIVLLASATTFAASSGELTISGTVSAVNDIIITPKAAATALNIIGGESAKSVATVSETSNSVTGYTISMRSANGGLLVNLDNDTKSTSYQVSYNGGDYLSLSTVDQPVKSTSTSELVTESSDVSVNVSAYGTAPAGTYEDVITISIAAND
jgi:hypothetical protein